MYYDSINDNYYLYTIDFDYSYLIYLTMANNNTCRRATHAGSWYQKDGTPRIILLHKNCYSNSMLLVVVVQWGNLP